MMMIFWGPSFIFLIASILTHMWPNLACEMARTWGRTSRGEVWNAKARNEHLPRPWFPFWKCRVSRRKYSTENLLGEHLPESWFLFALAAPSDGNRHSDCVRDVTQVKDWLVERTGLLKKPPSFRSEGLPARCPSRRSTPARSMTPGETPPSRSTSPQRRASSGIGSGCWNIYWQFLFNKLTNKVFFFYKDWFF